jgi:squalene synthase HpnC
LAVTTAPRDHVDLAAATDAAFRLRRLESAENFPVALRLLPGRWRRELRAVYDVARTVDDLGDDAAGDRSALLDAFDAELRTIWSDPASQRQPRLPVLRRLAPVVRAHGLPPEPFLALVAANRQDQVVSAYPTWDDLAAYCELSANPVGRIVLGLAGAATAANVELSDRVCTALQLLEHCQDVGEDRRRGRTYLPLDDLSRSGVRETDLDAVATSEQLRRALALEVDRAVGLLQAGPVLVRQLHGAARVAVAGFVAGGLATVDALRRADHEVLTAVPRPRRRDVARHGLRLLAGRR